MIHIILIYLAVLESMSGSLPQEPVKDTLAASVADTVASRSFPRPIPDYLDPIWFIPRDRLFGYEPWTYAPLERPHFPVLNVYGYDGTIGFGSYALQHPEKFFSTLEGRNTIDVPQYFVSRQMMLGNTLRLGRNFYFLSGILYGSQMGTMGNNWGMGTREGFIWKPSALLSVIFWTQYFQSVLVYSPVMFPRADRPGDMAVILMPATPEVFSFGVQASFIVGEFIIDVGTSVAPEPFQNRRHSTFRYK